MTVRAVVFASFAPHVAALLVASPAAAQLPFDRTIVATRLAGTAARTQLLAVDALGGVVPMGRFPSDVFMPFAIAFDPIDGTLLLAVDTGGTGTVVRLVPQATTIQAEVVLGSVPGPVTQLAVVGDAVFATVTGPGGGVWRLPRRGCCATTVLLQAEADAMFVFGQQPLGILAWSPGAAPAGLAYVDFTAGQPYYGPFAFGAPTAAVTGVVDVPTGLPRQLLSFADGTIATFVGFLGPPAPIALVPQPPPGGAVAMKSDGPSFVATGLGGVAFPFLYAIDANAGTTTRLAGPLPGDPVDFALPLPRVAQAVPFGVACGTPALAIGSSGGAPALGNAQFRVELTGAAPLQPCLLAAGFSDALASAVPAPVPLPFALPGGCPLHVDPFASLVRVTTATGAATLPLAIPNVPALTGTFLFAQWLQAPAGAIAVSGGLAVQVAP